MSTNFAILAFFSLMLTYLLICEVFTILFRLTGLTEETARFQVISMLTTCGFTTAESELITSSRKRKKLAFITILFGYIFSVTIVSMVINFFMRLTVSDENSFHLIIKVIFAIILLILIWYSISKVNFIKNNFDKVISKIGIKIMFKNQHNPIIVLGIFKSEVIAEITVTNLPEELFEIQLKDSNIRSNYNLQILTIIRNEDNSIIINGETTIENGDQVIIFGTLKNIKKLFVKEKDF
ncbi:MULTISPECIES: TrkA C-terminal domain-containing protein [Cetobacterium]|uniref:TrkA C-terminal domain-containing protein n=1 Tax=Candidatus Cetobacterium colombiensis TaxID=3073100 RepID=A0ABU4W6B4_9FUSO|nr:TrkA C-terminal domain-containing protein [Candidatus Cetobacterium colombiensis]MDX8335068.1 TrkA C-terminal domain-containing protein [Candidatus Cetobacterium colombiensis]